MATDIHMDQEIWTTLVCSNLARNLVPISYLTGNWKWFKKAIANSPKEEYLERSSSMYHFAVRQAMARIHEHNPTLGEHLGRAIRTGTYCAYLPDPRVPLVWKL